MLPLIRRFNRLPVPGLSSFERRPLFTDYEAWSLFRLAALAEAVGWTLLIAGIIIKYGLLQGNDAPVKVAGSVHGMLFLFYAVIAFVTYPSLGWTRLHAIFGLAASVPPYGSLLFERIMAGWRGYVSARQFAAVSLYNGLARPW